MPRKLLSIVGARPQFIKAAAVSRVLSQTVEIDEVIVHTGQHFDDIMSTVFFDELAIPEPVYNLEVHGGGHGEMTGRMLAALEPVMIDEEPAAVLVYGDTNTTLAGALAASKLHTPVIHVEAGLRSFNRRMPEEINRVLTDHLSTLLFCPTTEAVKNLANEGITDGVHHVGDAMFDATLHAREAALERSKILTELDLKPGEYALCTVHRAENTNDEARFRRVMAYLEDAARERPLVFPVHPRTRAVLKQHQLDLNGIVLTEPVGYLDLHRLLASAATLYTDSGGMQKEAYFHRVPCVTLRDETEWVETVEAGWNRLWIDDVERPRREIDEYGDGSAGSRMVELIRAFI